MTVIRWTGFGGENRAVHPKLLEDSLGTLSRNQKPGRGDLRPWKAPLNAATAPAGRKTIYRMGRDSSSHYWLSWTNRVHVARISDATDTTERTAYTGDGVPKWTNTTMALASAPYPTSSRPLGLPVPSSAPLITVGVAPEPEIEGTPPTMETVSYCYTWVNDMGWESAPSPPSALVERDVTAVVTVGGFGTVPSGNHQVGKVRVYRTQTGSDQFMFLREVAYGTSSTTDDNRSTGETMASLTWQPPPTNLKCLTALWNGMLAGISGNSVRFCEAYVPYAWPVAYDVIPPNAKPVALGVFGQSLLVLTDGRPLLVSGSGPDSVDQQLLDIPQSCVAPDSVVSMGTGVAWASDDGLCFYGSGGAKITTAGLLTREDWQALKPSSVIGQMYEGLYLGSYDDGSGRKGFFIDPGNPKGVFFLDTGYTTMHLDEFRDQLFVLDGAAVKQWDAGTSMTVKARSKVYRQTKPTNFACAEVVADSYPVTFRMYADGELKHTQTVASAEPFRLPSGYRAMNFQLEVEGTHAIQAVLMGQSMAELATV